MNFRANVIANYLGQGWAAAMNVAFVPVYVAYLGIESYALIGIYTVLQAWFALLDLGMSPTLSREMARFIGGSLSARAATELLRSVELVCAGFVALCALIVAAAAPWIATQWLASSLPTADTASALRLCALVVACRFMETLYRSALYGLDRQVWYNGVNVVVTTARFAGGAAVLVLVAPTIHAFFLWQLAVSVASLMVLRSKAHGTLPTIVARRFSGAALRGIGSFAGGLVAINLTALVLTQADKVVISHALPLTMLGYYSLAYTVSGVLAAAVGPVSQAFYPVLSRQHAADDRDGLLRSYSLGAQIVSVAVIAPGAVLVLFPAELLTAWSDNPVMAATVAPIVRLLSVGALANALLQIPYFTLLARGVIRAPLYLNIAAAGLFLTAVLLLVPSHGLRGAAWCWIGVNLGMLLATILTLHPRHLPGRVLAWIGSDVIGPVAAGLIAAAAVRWLTPPDLSRLGMMTAVAGAGGGALLASALAAPALRDAVLARTRHRARLGGLLS